MKTLGFGQSTGQIVQMAYTVKDVQAAMRWWIDEAKVGPWFLLDSFKGAGHVYRGKPSTADVAIAMAFAGHMQIELIQPKDENPSVYRDLIQRRGHGFHHVGIGVAPEELDAERVAYERRGYTVAFEAPVPSGGNVYYMDDGRNEPGFVELIPATAGMDELFTKYWRASIGWKGENPVRPFG
jgi:hypothetical protein